MTRPDPMQELAPRLARYNAPLLGLGAIGAVALVLGAVFQPEAFFPAYLMAWVFWVGVSLGSMAILLLQGLVGGQWGYIIRRPLESAAMNMPLMALLFIPIFFGMHILFPWTHPEVMQSEKMVADKALYLNTPFFVIRQVLYFIIWSVVIFWARARSRRLDRVADPLTTYRQARAGALGLMIYFTTFTFASTDWLMSLEPRFISTMFPVMVMIGQALMAICLATGMALLLAHSRTFQRVLHRSRVNDLGNLMLAFVILWTYMAFMEWIIVWNGNIPDDAIWFSHRAQGGWEAIPVLLLAFHFAVPFAIMLSRTAKRNTRVVFALAAGLMVIHFVDTFWLVIPSFEQGAFRLGWQQFVAPLAIGGFWLALYLRTLRSAPLLVRHDPQYEKVVEAALRS